MNQRMSPSGQKRRWIRVLALLGAQIGAVVAVVVWFEPDRALLAGIVFAWPSVAALTAVIGLAGTGHATAAGAVSGLTAALMGGFLFVTHVDLSPEEEISALSMAFALVLSCVPLAVCGGFVQIIATRLDAVGAASRRECLIVAAKKGFSFSLFCVAITAPVLYLLLPPSKTRGVLEVLAILAGYSAAGLLVGTLLASLVGATYARSDADGTN